MARTLSGKLAALEKKVAKFVVADKLPDPSAGGILLAQNDHFGKIELIEYLVNPVDILHKTMAGSYLAKLRSKHTAEELEDWMSKFQKGEFWKRLTPNMKHILVYGKELE